MPRTARLDIAGVLQHVMIRGIEQRDIFADDRDRRSFLDRFCSLLDKMGMECLAWALMSNHVHMLLRPHDSNLGVFMRRLLTGHAVTFNLRHKRCGHLFQNRYKSIVCEDDPYLLELVRYIHLNPLRAGLVKDINELKSYPWSGHSTIMGITKNQFQKVDEVLLYFSKQRKPAREKYQLFVAEGIDLGKRNELVGGGLRRVLKGLGNDFIRAYDERILGSGDFVDLLREDSETSDRLEMRLPLSELIAVLAERYGLPVESFSRRGRGLAISEAKGIICYVATRRLRYSGEAVGKALGITRSGACRGAERGAEILKQNLALHDELEAIVNKSTTSP